MYKEAIVYHWCRLNVVCWADALLGCEVLDFIVHSVEKQTITSMHKSKLKGRETCKEKETQMWFLCGSQFELFKIAVWVDPAR